LKPSKKSGERYHAQATKVKDRSTLGLPVALGVVCAAWLGHPRRAHADDSTPLKVTPSPAMMRMLEPRLTWDANLEGGLGRVFSSPGETVLFGRARGGLTLVRGPFYESLGLTYEYSRLSPATLGVQVEVAHLARGFWGQGGGMLDVKGRPGAMLSFGWALVGVEGDVRGLDSQGPAWAVFGKIRIPISIFAIAAWNKREPAHPAAPVDAAPAPPTPSLR
jgi:hypothetical protein